MLQAFLSLLWQELDLLFEGELWNQFLVCIVRIFFQWVFPHTKLKRQIIKENVTLVFRLCLMS